MFVDGQKALIVSGSSSTRLKWSGILPRRYNLGVETVKDICAAREAVNGFCRRFEVVILDDFSLEREESFKLHLHIRDRSRGTSVFYLSTLQERNEDRSKVTSTGRLQKMTELCRPLFYNALAKGAYQEVCRRMVEVFDAKVGFVVLRDPVDQYRAMVVEQFPKANGRPRFFQLDVEQMPELADLLTYFVPVHIPSASLEGPLEQVLKVPLGVMPESVLLSPLVCREQSIGFTGIFNRLPDGVFTLEDLDICHRFTDTLARSFCRNYRG
jgi:hypothetical protein